MEETALLQQYNTETLLNFMCSMNYFQRRCCLVLPPKQKPESQVKMNLPILTLNQNSQHGVGQIFLINRCTIGNSYFLNNSFCASFVCPLQCTSHRQLLFFFLITEKLLLARCPFHSISFRTINSPTFS